MSIVTQDLSEIVLSTSGAATVLKQIDEVIEKVEQVSKLKVNIEMGGLKSFVDLQERLAKAQNAATSAEEKLGRVMAQNDKAALAALKRKEQGLKIDREVVGLIKDEAAAEAAQIRTQQAKQRQDEAGIRNAERQAKLAADAASEYRKLEQALKAAEDNFKQLFLTAGPAAGSTRQALTEAQNIRKVLDSIDQPLNNYRRNVGNYASGFNGLNNSLQQILREAPAAAVSLNTFFLAISNNLPMFFDEITRIKNANKELAKESAEAAAIAGIQAREQAILTGATSEAAEAVGVLASEQALANGEVKKGTNIFKAIGSSLFSVGTLLNVAVLALTLFGGKIIDYVSSLFKVENATNRVRDAHRQYVEVLNSGAQASANEVVQLRVLEKAATDVTKPMKERLQAVDDLQEKYPFYLKNVKDEAILHGQAATQINLVADALVKKAFAEAASAKAGEIAGKQLDLEMRRNFLLNEQFKARQKLAQVGQNDTPDGSGTSGYVKRAAQRKQETDHLIELDRLLKINGEQYKFNGEQIEFFTNKAAENFGKVKSLEVDKKKPKDIKTIAESIAELRNELEAIRFETESGIISEDAADVKRLEKYKSTLEEIFKLQASAKDKRIAAIQLEAEMNPISLRVLQDQLRDMVSKLDRTAPEIRVPVVEVYEKGKAPKNRYASFDDTKAYADRLAAQQKQLSIENNQEQQALLIRYQSGLIKRKDYQKALLKIQESFAEESVQIQIDSLKAEYNNAFDGVEQTQEVADKKLAIEEKLASLQLDLEKKRADKGKRTNADRLNDLQEFLQGTQAAFNEVAGLIDDAINIGVTKRKNALQELEDLQQKAYENELARVNDPTSTLTEQQKILRIATLEKQRQIQKEQFDKKNREEDQKRARFEKARTIASIILEGSLAVVHQLTSGDPVTQTIRAVAVGALAAAKLAAAIATPIAKYKEGLDRDLPGHKGIYAEDGPEVLKKPGRPAELITSPSVGWLPKGTRIYPVTKNLDSMVSRALSVDKNGNLRDNGDEKLYKQNEMIINELRKSNKKKATVKVSAVFNEQRKKADYYGRK